MEIRPAIGIKGGRRVKGSRRLTKGGHRLTKGGHRLTKGSRRLTKGGHRLTTRRPRKQRSRKQRSRGGFVPSVMEPFVTSVSKYIVPLVLYSGYKLMTRGKTAKKYSRK